MSEPAYRRPVTEPQRDALRFVQRYHDEHKIAPTVREIGDALGIAPSTAYARLRQLLARQLIQRVPDSPRSITVTAKGRCAMEAA